MAWRRAIGAVKDRTSIGLARVNNSSNSLSDLDVAIVKATRHEEYPAEEKYIREILSLTSYSRLHIGACINTICRRLNKTRNWVVALKTLMLIQRLLMEGDPAYEQEIFFATRRGTRLLNLSDFRDTSESNSWDYSAFVRTYSLYLDEKLEYKMQGRRKKHKACMYSYEEDDYEDLEPSAVACARLTPPVKEMRIEQILSKMNHLMQFLERFLSTRPTGSAKHHRIILVALHPIVKESFNIYYEITDILSILIDKFMELEIPECVTVHEIFCRISKQFDELDSYYHWCKAAGVSRSSECPEVERITPKKLDLMDDFIRDKAANAQNKRFVAMRDEEDNNDKAGKETEVVEEDLTAIKALPPPEGFSNNVVQEEEKPKQPKREDEKPQQKEDDLLNLGDDDAVTSEEHGKKLALALFDGGVAVAGPPPAPIWEAFNNTSEWETALVQSASHLPHQKASLGGGFDTMLLDGLYQQGATAVATSANAGGTGSASSVVFGSVGNPPSQMLALPAPPSSGGMMITVNADPFAASLGLPAPPYVQMSDMEKKQKLLVEEQVMWQQYTRDGMQGQIELTRYQTRQQNINMGGYGYGYGYGY
ncbi:hypothetical protein Ancab_023934 [Ancistrocladus abbreviatus]